MSQTELSYNQLDDWAADFTNSLSAPTVVLLDGTLGAGKTQLVKKILEASGVEQASSPTFSLINYYQTQQFGEVCHVDLYRLTDEEDLDSTGFWDLFESHNLIFIEWANKIDKEDLPLDWNQIQIQIEKTDDPQKRIIRIKR